MSCPFLEEHTFGKDYCNEMKDWVENQYSFKYCRDSSRYEECPKYKNNVSGGGCFLTSACTEARNLPDDCRELTTLRHFRDTYLKARENGESDIAEYYAKAPLIVAKIKEQENSKAVFESFYTELVEPCIKYINANEPEAAYRHYADYFKMLKEKYGV